MKELRIKVCGMRDADNILAVSRLNPDFLGFIFYHPSPRFVGDAFEIPANIVTTVKKVGVFVNESVEVLLDKVKDFTLDYVQLHGGESRDDCYRIKDSGVKVIKVFSVDDETDFQETVRFADVVDYFLFDTKGKLHGGNARRFNWDVLNRYNGVVPYFLSGGIGPEHMDQIKELKDNRLYAIDVNSGVEVRPGYKDLEKVKAITAVLKG